MINPYSNYDRWLDIACKSNSLKLAKYFIECGANQNLQLKYSIESENKELFRLLVQNNIRDNVEPYFNTIIEKGYIELIEIYMIYFNYNINWDTCLLHAAKGGHMSSIEYFIDKSKYDPNKGLYGAALGSHLKILQYFINKGAIKKYECLCYAAEGGNMKIIQWCLEKTPYLNYGLQGSSKGGHIDIVQFFIDKGANDWNLGLKSAALGGHINLVQLFIDKGANNWNESLVNAAQGGNSDIVQLLINKGANDWNNAIVKATESGYIDIVRLLYDKIDDKSSSNIYDCLKKATIKNHFNIIQLLIEPFIHDLGDCIYIATDNHNVYLVNYFLKKQTITVEDPNWFTNFRNRYIDNNKYKYKPNKELNNLLINRIKLCDYYIYFLQEIIDYLFLNE